MKKVKVVFPASVADRFADYLLINSATIRALISWGTEDFFSNNSITVILATTDEQLTEFRKTEFNKYIKN
jgi:hypothetical protein